LKLQGPKKLKDNQTPHALASRPFTFNLQTERSIFLDTQRMTLANLSNCRFALLKTLSLDQYLAL
jgi:hypothetical protein